MLAKPGAIAAISLLVAAAAVAVVAWRFAIFILPFSWTGETERIADLLRVRPGSTVADIGAGDGALAIDMARLVGEGGVVYATELSAERQREIVSRASRAGTPQVHVVNARADATQLPDACCDAVYLRTVFHHIRDRSAFAREIGKAVRPAGRLVIIDFPPGALWFHGRDHGVTAAEVIGAFGQAGLSLTQQIDNWGGGTYLLLFERTTH